MAPKELNFITGNKNKLLEVQAILGSTGVDLKSQSVDLLEIQGTIEEISKDKCRRAADIVCKYVMFNQVKFTKLHVGWRPCTRRRHMPLLRRLGRASRSIRVRASANLPLEVPLTSR